DRPLGMTTAKTSSSISPESKTANSPCRPASGYTSPSRSQPMTPPKRMYDFRIVGWQVFTPEEQERMYMQLLTSQNVEVSDAMRKLILEEWPELAHKLAPKRAPE